MENVTITLTRDELYEIRVRYSMSENVYSESQPYHTLHKIVLGETLIEYAEYSSAMRDGVSGGWRGWRGDSNGCLTRAAW